MVQIASKTCYIIEKEKIAHNVRLLRDLVDNRCLYAVMKADGYGVGCQELAAICAENGLTRFAVTRRSEAEAILSAGIAVEELLMMTSAPAEEIPVLRQMGVTFTVASEADARNLAPYDASAHIKVDTGMGRRGFWWEDRKSILKLYTDFPYINYSGIYTHFADGACRKKAMVQYRRFCSVLENIEAVGISPGIRHCCNSAAVLHQPDMYLDGVRLGSALFGRISSGEAAGLLRTGVCQVPIEAVRNLPKGATLGYGSTYRTRKPMQVALCPIGTHHGFGVATQLGVQGWQGAVEELQRWSWHHVLHQGFLFASVAGMRCPVLGRPCTEAVMLDVTGLNCQVGDVAQFDINPIFLQDVPVQFI